MGDGYNAADVSGEQKYSKELQAAINEAGGDVMATTLGMPSEFNEGTIEFTFFADPFGGEPTPQDIRFTWGGTSTVTWWLDISGHVRDLSPASSSPSEGWASFRNRKDLLVAYTSWDQGIDGFAHVPAGAPGADLEDGWEDALTEPLGWVELARVIVDVEYGVDRPGVTGQTFE